MAEVYWDLEWTLQQQGFDYAYDKRLYDRLREGHARPVREHFTPGWTIRTGWRVPRKPRRAARGGDLPAGRPEAAAVITFLSPGLRFFHQGQFEGRRKRISPHLVAGRKRRPNRALQAVLRPAACGAAPGRRPRRPMAVAGVHVRLGRQLDVGLLRRLRLAEQPVSACSSTVNYAPNQSQCYVGCRSLNSGRRVAAERPDGDVVYDRNGGDLASRGLYVDATPWQASVFAVTRTH